MHEAQMHKENTYITLTYNEEHLPINESLDVKHWQDFMKALRHSLPNKKIRFFHCGEYGGLHKRAHYHAIIFGHEFRDKIPWGTSPDGSPLYMSQKLTDIWSKGNTVIGDLTFQSAAYVARYIVKKINGKKAELHYTHITRHGEIVQRKPEYATMSRNKGIGSSWYEKYKSDVYPSGYCVINGRKTGPPKYYQFILEQENNAEFQIQKDKLLVQKHITRLDNTKKRLLVKETCTIAKTKNQKRDLGEII